MLTEFTSIATVSPHTDFGRTRCQTRAEAGFTAGFTAGHWRLANRSAGAVVSAAWRVRNTKFLERLTEPRVFSSAGVLRLDADHAFISISYLAAKAPFDSVLTAAVRPASNSSGTTKS